MSYLKQCKVPPSSSKKEIPNVQKERGRGGGGKGVLNAEAEASCNKHRNLC